MVEAKGNRPKGIVIRVTGSFAAALERLRHSKAIKILGQFLCTDHINHQNMNEFRKCLLSCAYPEWAHPCDRRL